jgi:hypothetical protein
MPAQHDIAAETELWDAYAGSAFTEDAEPVFRWTQYAGHGPGPEILGGPESVLEIGCGTGRALTPADPGRVRHRGGQRPGRPRARPHRHASGTRHGMTPMPLPPRPQAGGGARAPGAAAPRQGAMLPRGQRWAAARAAWMSAADAGPAGSAMNSGTCLAA